MIDIGLSLYTHLVTINHRPTIHFIEFANWLIRGSLRRRKKEIFSFFTMEGSVRGVLDRSFDDELNIGSSNRCHTHTHTRTHQLVFNTFHLHKYPPLTQSPTPTDTSAYFPCKVIINTFLEIWLRSDYRQTMDRLFVKQ